MSSFIQQTTPLFEQSLFQVIASIDDCDQRLLDAMLYACKSGGKRLRPLIVLAVSQLENHSLEETLPLAQAIEMVHTYSLIHDDLPGMDNDDFRRGKPTVHKQFDEATAILAGDALLTESFRMITKSKLTADKKVKGVSLLAASSGASGMISGQMQDIESEKREVTIDDLRKIHQYKTGKLLQCSLELGLLQLHQPEEVEDALRTFMNHFGLAFQIQNDLQDVLWDAKKTGKETGKDAQLEKNTYPRLLGIDGAKQKLKNEIQSARQALKLLPTVTPQQQAGIDFFETLLTYVEI